MLTPEFKNHLSGELSSHFRAEITISDVFSISGGSINQTLGIKTNYAPFFLKINQANRYPGMFEKEVSGLNLMQGKSGLIIPKSILLGSFQNLDYLILEFLEKGNIGEGFWDNLGKGLAKLHQNSNDFYGLHYDNYIGSLPQSNVHSNKWSPFFIDQRLNPLVKLARNNGLIDEAEVQQFERFYKVFEDIFPEETPALLHGDLWSGNFMYTKSGNPALFDPAVYYGHREMDIAMTKLFGGFSPEFYEAYNGYFPLEKGWKKRVEICNLYPLLVHLNLFGKSYWWDIKQVIQRF